ncbi:fatty acid synthase-like isoform X1 [Haemaphysalis longicornis]
MSDDDIVISGFSARFPQADSLSEFGEKLYRGDDFVTDDGSRWPLGFMGLPDRMGTIRDLSKFDAQFFGVLAKQAQVMDPQLRLLLETSYEAIFDAGYDPVTLRGQKIGVFVGCSVSGMAGAQPYLGADETEGYSMLGSSLSMFSNRISYSFDFHGPSETVDTACASTMTALNHAVLAIRSGKCDAAIVGGSNFVFNPASSVALHRMTMLSPEGKCKVFDANADGFVRSEAVGAFFVQVGSKARRVYAKLVDISSNADGYKTEGITYPSGNAREKLLREAYAEAKVDPLNVCYVEVHGTGTKKGDPEEVGAISRFFCQSPRERPLMIGSVKSNVGHAEGASGICSMAKVILAMETGTIAGNIHFVEPNPNISSLFDGTIEVVDRNKPLPGAFVGINASGFGGTNVHTILQAHSGPHVKSLPRLKTHLPRLVIMAGRTADALASTLERLQVEGSHPDSTYALLNNVGQPNVKQFPFRGFTLVPPDETCKAAVKGAPKEVPWKRRPLWYVFTGMGCQWNGMARQMMQFDVFARSIHKSHEVLKQFNLDLIGLVTTKDLGTESMASTFVSITAFQVALVDMLTAVGIKPDGFLGHSMGEIGCAYLDGALTAEQAVLCAYWRGRCTELGNMPKGAMAVVGLTWQEAQSRCGSEIFLACHNAADSVTVSGLAEPMERFLDELKAERVFVSAVNCLDVAFHCPHVHNIGPALREALEKVIPEPKLRSSHWVSTSVTERCWTEPIGQRCSADYLINNFLSPVFFYEGLQRVPRDAIVIEIAPHSLLQGILRGGLSDATCLRLMKRDSDNSTLFLSTLGELHTLGVQLDLSSLYPPVAWPVPRGTPSIAHYVSWDHSQNWNVIEWKDLVNIAKASEEVVEVDLKANEGDAHLAERELNGQVLFPAAAYMVLAWKSLAAQCAKHFDEVPVIFDHVTIHQEIMLPKSGAVSLRVNVTRDTEQFQVSKDGVVVASGRIRVAGDDMKLLNASPHPTPEGAVVYELEAEDVYKELRLRGYKCNGVFRGICKTDINFRNGKLQWEDNWVTFMDAMFQFVALHNYFRTVTMPTRIEFCCIDPQLHARIVENAGDAGADVVYERYLNTCRAGGVALRNVTYNPIPRSSDPEVPLLEEFRFIPYFDSEADRQRREASLQDYIEMCSSIAYRILDLCSPDGTDPFTQFFKVDGISAKSPDSFPAHLAENHGLLRTLITVLKFVNDSTSSLAVCVHSALYLHKRDLEADILNTALFGEDPLRHVLDIVTENVTGKNVRILELAFVKNSLLLAPWIRSLLHISYSTLKSEYTVARAFSDITISEEQLNDINVIDLQSVSSSEGELSEAHLVVTRVSTLDHVRHRSLPEKLSSICKENGFALIAVRTALSPAELFLRNASKTAFKFPACEALQARLEDNGFRLVAHKSNNLSSLLLFRKCTSPVESFAQEVVKIRTTDSDWVEELKDKAQKLESAPRERTLWLLSENAGISGIMGLVKCLLLESAGRHIRCVFDASHSGSNKVSNFSPSHPEYREIMKRDLVMNVYFDGQWGSYRHTLMQTGDALKKTTQFAHLKVTPGDISSIQWYGSPQPYKSSSTANSTDRVLCSVYYAPLNSQDIQIATGNSRQDAFREALATAESSLGIEFSGRDPSGRRVMGLVASEGMATVVTADLEFLWEVPAAWTLQQASTVPMAYSAAYYALVVRGNMRARESLLVHGGSCDAAQAAISIALSMGCTVFTTIGSAEEHHFLKLRFPELDKRHIVNCMEASIERNVFHETKGMGVNMVLNIGAGSRFQESMCCLSPYGRFLDMRPLEDISDDIKLGNFTLLKNITFHRISLNELLGNDASAAGVKSHVAQLVRGGIASGAVRPLDSTLFGLDNAQDAFRFMASRTHTGKVVLEIRAEESERNAVPASLLTVEAVARTHFYEDKSYIIIGGLGGVGLELADWMVSRGCRKLLLCSRSGVRNGYQRLCLHHWKRAGAEVLVSTAEVSTEKGATETIEKAKSLGPGGGVFNLAAVLRDALLENQTEETYGAVCKPKVDVTRCFDVLTRRLCPELDHFVVFSSVVCGRGNGGQTNYGYANSVIERICERRVADGFPALAIQWGAIADVGFFHEATGLDAGIHGTRPQRITSCLEVLDRLLNQNVPVVSCSVKADKSPEIPSENTQDLVQLISQILGMNDSSSLKPHVTLGELGLDSMIGVKVQDTIERHCGLVLSMQQIAQLNVHRLEEMSQGTKSQCKSCPV